MLLQSKENVAMDEFTIKLNHFRPIHSRSPSLPAFTLRTTQVSPAWQIKGRFPRLSLPLFATLLPISSPPKVNGTFWASSMELKVTFPSPIIYSCLSLLLQLSALDCLVLCSPWDQLLAWSIFHKSLQNWRSTIGKNLPVFLCWSLFPQHIWSSQP